MLQGDFVFRKSSKPVNQIFPPSPNFIYVCCQQKLPMAFNALDTILDFIDPINLSGISNDEGYSETQIGHHITAFENSFPDIENADIIILGCNDARGEGINKQQSIANTIRNEFYSLYHWHAEVTVADIGNVKTGATIQDTYSAVKAICSELLRLNKRICIIGGSHDIMMAQYQAYAEIEKIIEASCVDAFINLDNESAYPASKFLMQMFTGEPNFLKHYNHIGFQSYFVHPDMLETIDKLHFDCYRVGKVKELIEAMEPVVRNANLFAFDISAIQQAHAPANRSTPNGFTGEEACKLMQYAGMSRSTDSIGIFGYIPSQDQYNLTAKQISQMLWYLMDGIQRGKEEADFTQQDSFKEFRLAFADFETTFKQSKRTGRWWMQLPDESFIACSNEDYLTALKNEIPERFLRAVERS